MTDTFKRLGGAGITPGTSYGTMYTVPASTQVILKHMRIVNASTSTASQLTLWHGSQTNANLLLPLGGVVFQPGEWAEWDGALEMSAAEVIAGLQTVASIIVVQLYGDEIT